jgi:hypothetical protein
MGIQVNEYRGKKIIASKKAKLIMSNKKPFLAVKLGLF